MNKLKFVYVAHPIGGDVENNLKKIAAIVKKINLEEPDVVPVCSYYADCVAMDDDIPIERARGMHNCLSILRAGFIDELRLYGHKFSKGMQEEAEAAAELQIQIRPMSEGMRESVHGWIEEKREVEKRKFLDFAGDIIFPLLYGKIIKKNC